jgi:hypothetical protein
MKINNRKLLIHNIGSVIIELQRDMGIYTKYKLTFKGFTTCEVETSFENIEQIYNAAKELRNQWNHS